MIECGVCGGETALISDCQSGGKLYGCAWTSCRAQTLIRNDQVLTWTREEMGLVDCDNLTCNAKLNPTTIEELTEAVEHWRRHSRLHGCSHGH